MPSPFDLLCGLLSPATETAARGAATDGLDWDAVLDAARRRGLEPLLAWRLAGGGRLDGLPGGARDALIGAAALQAARAAGAVQLLAGLLGRLEKDGIATLALKGPVTSHRAYGDAGARTFTDLDLLVDPRERLRAAGILRELGFTSSFDGLPGGGRFFAATSDIVLQRPADGARVDLCRGFDSHGFRLDLPFARLMERSVVETIDGVPLRTLSPSDEFLYLCYHGTKHAWYRLQWALDIAWLAARNATGLGWEPLWRAAERAGGAASLSLGLRLASDLFGAPVPEAIRERVLRDRAAAALAPEAAGRLRTDTAPADRRTTARFEWRATPPGPPRLRYLARHLFGPTPSDYQWRPLPRPLFPLYYLLRPVRLTLFRRRSNA